MNVSGGQYSDWFDDLLSSDARTLEINEPEQPLICEMPSGLELSLSDFPTVTPDFASRLMASTSASRRQALSDAADETGLGNLFSSLFPSPQQEYENEFLQAVMASTADVWSEKLKGQKPDYVPPKMVAVTSFASTACHMPVLPGDAPRYCPADTTAYVSPLFFGLLRSKFNLSNTVFGDASVIAHEVGHHVQRFLGLDNQIGPASGMNMSPNEKAMRNELQADCFAGIWLHDVQQEIGPLTPNEVRSVLEPVALLGDDLGQLLAGKPINPSAFDHGSRDQRLTWFLKGFATGRLKDCNTFGASNL